MTTVRATLAGVFSGALIAGGAYTIVKIFEPSTTKSIMGAEFYKLPKCNDVERNLNIDLRNPTVVHKLDISALNVKSLTRKIKKKRADGAGEDEDPMDNGSDDNTIPPAPKDPTKWDIDLSLQPPTMVGGKLTYDTVLIKIISSDGDVSIRNDKYAIRAGDDNGRQMFCDAKWGGGVAKFKAFYYDDGGSSTFGSYNIGIIVKDGNYRNPIFIDPNVKNNG